MRVQIVGQGRVGGALAASLRAVGGDLEVPPVQGRGSDGRSAAGPADVVLLAVPDAQIDTAARLIAPGPLVGHLSGATTLQVLVPHTALSLHPLLSITGPESSFAGAYAAIAGATPAALAVAESLARALGLTPFEVADADRAAYHAAASLAANALVTLEWVAEQLAATAGVPREALAPLAQAALANWEARGAAAALTGPIARGDTDTVARQRAAVAERLPGELPLFDELMNSTRRLAARSDAKVVAPGVAAGAAAAAASVVAAASAAGEGAASTGASVAGEESAAMAAESSVARPGEGSGASAPLGTSPQAPAPRQAGPRTPEDLQ